jgi:hypothetical protein
MGLEDRKVLKLIERIEKQKRQANRHSCPNKRIESVECCGSLVMS